MTEFERVFSQNDEDAFFLDFGPLHFIPRYQELPHNQQRAYYGRTAWRLCLFVYAQTVVGLW